MKSSTTSMMKLVTRKSTGAANISVHPDGRPEQEAFFAILRFGVFTSPAGCSGADAATLELLGRWFPPRVLFNTLDF